MKLWLFLIIFQCLDALNIVVYLKLVGKSHIDFAASLIEVLVDRGHNVDYIIAELNSGVKWQGSSKARNVTSFGFGGESPWMQMNHLQDPFQENTHFDMAQFWKVQGELCKIGLDSGKPLAFMKSGNYDAAIVSDYSYCGAILARAAGIPTIMSYTATNIMYSQILHIGLPNPTSCVAENFDPYQGDFSLWSKIGRLFYLAKYNFIYRPRALDRLTSYSRSVFGPDFPATEDIIRNYDLTFINSNEIIETPRTISHKVKYIGGIGLKKPKPEFEHLLSLPSQGAIIFSFGTQVPSNRVNQRVKSLLARAFGSFPEYTFIWKYEEQPGDNVTFKGLDNVHMVKWLPQNDLLHNKKVKAFITHAGLNSFLEAAAAGVPVIAIPLFADQGFNAHSMSRLGMGVHLDKTTFTSDDLIYALDQVLHNDSYLQKAQKISKMMAHKPEQAKKSFAEWVEYAATHPGLHEMLNLPESGMNPLLYYCLDVILTISVIAIFMYIFVRRIVAMVRGGSARQKVKIN